MARHSPSATSVAVSSTGTTRTATSSSRWSCPRRWLVRSPPTASEVLWSGRMGLANGLTVLRILLIPVFVTLLVDRKPGWALLVFSIAALTDLLDGWVARYQGMQSRLGAFLDPMADKMLLMASFVTLTYLKALPFWITAVVITRDAPGPRLPGSALGPGSSPSAARRSATRSTSSSTPPTTGSG